MEIEVYDKFVRGNLGTADRTIITFGAVAIISAIAYNGFRNSTEDKLQSGYVNPSKLEITAEDLDKNGENETVMKYDGNLYLLRIDEYRKPVVQEYEIKSAEIVPKSNKFFSKKAL